MTIARPFLAAAFCLIASIAQAQTYDYIPGRADSPALDVYSFEGAEDAPVMVYVHGGAWVTGDKSRVHRKDDFFLQQGYVFISVNYTLVPETSVEGQLEEIDAALGYIVANVARAGGDPNNISLMGHSAGAHLVSMTALRPLANARALMARGGLRAVISNDTRAYNIPRLAALRGGRLPPAYARPFGTTPARWAALSPQSYAGDVSWQTPPFLLAYSGQGNPELRASFTQDFAAELRRAGARVTVFDGRAYSHEAINKEIGVSAGITGAVERFLAGIR